MNIAYAAPLQRAWRHAKALLFQPFNLGTWLVLGFSAWLANLMDGGAGGGGRFPRTPDRGFRLRASDFTDPLRDAWSWIAGRPGLLTMISVAAVLAVAVALLLLWISSRGKFVFLDNVLHGRAGILEPWTRFRRQGNSLFLWRVGFFFVAAALFAIVAGLVLAMGGGFSGLGFGSPGAVTLTLVGGGLGLLLLLGVVYVALFVDSFVVPLMARYDLTATAAWAMLLPWIESHLGAFILYGLFVLVLGILVGLAVMVFGLVTCCIGFLVLAIPYVGTVLLLPVYVTYRAFSVEFLAQFDPSLKTLPASQPE